MLAFLSLIKSVYVLGPSKCSLVDGISTYLDFSLYFLIRSKSLVCFSDILPCT